MSYEYDWIYVKPFFEKEIITHYYIVMGKILERQSQGNISKADCAKI